MESAVYGVLHLPRQLLLFEAFMHNVGSKYRIIRHQTIGPILIYREGNP
jgi:hypothetical protein